MRAVNKAFLHMYLEAFAQISVTLNELMERDADLARFITELADSPADEELLSRLEQQVIRLTTSASETEYADDDAELGPLTEAGWTAARASLGNGTQSALFGTSSRSMDSAVAALQLRSKR